MVRALPGAVTEGAGRAGGAGPRGSQAEQTHLLAALALLSPPLELLEGDLPFQVIDQLRAEARHRAGSSREREQPQPAQGNLVQGRTRVPPVMAPAPPRALTHEFRAAAARPNAAALGRAKRRPLGTGSRRGLGWRGVLSPGGCGEPGR